MGRPVTRLGELGRRLANVQDRRASRRTMNGPPPRVWSPRWRAKRPRAPSRRRIGVWVVAIAIALAALGAARLFRHAEPALTFSSGDAHGEVGRWLAAPPASKLPLRFSDGSVLTLAPAARARVASSEQAGAEIVLERGTLACEIVHRAGTRWRVHVGPFAVAVTGTRFEVSWQPEAENFRLRLDEGSVRLTGPHVDGERIVRAGETVEMSARGDVAAREAAGETPAAPSPCPSLSPSPSLSLSLSPSPSPSPSPSLSPSLSLSPSPTASASGKVSPPASWRELAKAGDYKAALRVAEDGGFDATCASGDADEVQSLGDTARLAGDFDRAKHAYLAVRRRHPGTGAAAVGALALGRLAFDHDGAFASAASWFEAYLAEQPDGPLAREAAGRLIEAREREGDRISARAAARRYLSRWPDGPHAEKARSLLP